MLVEGVQQKQEQKLVVELVVRNQMPSEWGALLVFWRVSNHQKMIAVAVVVQVVNQNEIPQWKNQQISFVFVALDFDFHVSVQEVGVSSISCQDNRELGDVCIQRLHVSSQ